MGHVRLIVLAGVLVAGRASAQTSDDSERARVLFAEALADQDAGRPGVALEKFRRVATARDTAQVEYRIATCLEALGQRRAALTAYDRAAHLGRGEVHAEDVVASANEHVTALALHMGKVHVVVHGVPRAEVKIDGANVSDDELASSVALEPGEHVVDVSSPGGLSTRTHVTVAEGQRRELAIDLKPDAPPTTTEVSWVRRDVGLAVGGVGLACVIGAGVTLLVRKSLIDDIVSNCPGNVCPTSTHDSVESMRAEALTLGPVAAVIGSIGLATLAVGGVLVALGGQKRTVAAVVPSTTGAMFVLRGAF